MPHLVLVVVLDLQHVAHASTDEGAGRPAVEGPAAVEVRGSGR